MITAQCFALSMDTDFCSADDTPGFWDGFWDDGYGRVRRDPDALSRRLMDAHRALWSRELPSGDVMELHPDGTYLSWNDLRLSSDSVTTFFRGPAMSDVIGELESSMPDYRRFAEDIVRRTYVPGGAVLFPRHRNSFNQRRGIHPCIRDRWDRSLECIRRYYSGEESPLSEVLEQDARFFDLFGDFRDYVDFFLLQDCVDSRYEVISCLGPLSFEADPLPRNVDEYMTWVRSQLDLVQRRGQRMAALLARTDGS